MDKHLWRPNRKLGCGILPDICHSQPTIDTYLWKVVVVPKEIQAYDVGAQLKLFSPWVTTMSSLKHWEEIAFIQGWGQEVWNSKCVMEHSKT
jgi:hypothetical protein